MRRLVVCNNPSSPTTFSSPIGKLFVLRDVIRQRAVLTDLRILFQLVLAPSFIDVCKQLAISVLIVGFKFGCRVVSAQPSKLKYRNWTYAGSIPVYPTINGAPCLS